MCLGLLLITAKLLLLLSPDPSPTPNHKQVAVAQQTLQLNESWDEEVAGIKRNKLKVLHETIDKLTALHKVHLEMKNSSGNLGKDSQRNCGSFYREANMPRTMLRNIWREYTSYDSDDVAVVTQTSQNRIGRIERLLNHWNGPVSVAICVDLEKKDEFFHNMEACPNIFTRQDVDLHLVVKEGVSIIKAWGGGGRRCLFQSGGGGGQD